MGCSPHILLLLQDPTQHTHCLASSCPLSLLWFATVPQPSPGFLWPWQVSEVPNTPQRELSDVVPRLGFCILEKTALEVTCPSHHIVSGDRMLRSRLTETRRQTLSKDLKEMREWDTQVPGREELWAWETAGANVLKQEWARHVRNSREARVTGHSAQDSSTKWGWMDTIARPRTVFKKWGFFLSFLCKWMT